MTSSSRPVPRAFAGLEPMLSIEELADYLGKPVRTIYDWRLSGRGPRAVHVGRSLRYRVCDVEAWLDSQLERAPGEHPESGGASG